MEPSGGQRTTPDKGRRPTPAHQRQRSRLGILEDEGLVLGLQAPSTGSPQEGLPAALRLAQVGDPASGVGHHSLQPAGDYRVDPRGVIGTGLSLPETSGIREVAGDTGYDSADHYL